MPIDELPIYERLSDPLGHSGGWQDELIGRIEWENRIEAFGAVFGRSSYFRRKCIRLSGFWAGLTDAAWAIDQVYRECGFLFDSPRGRLGFRLSKVRVSHFSPQSPDLPRPWTGCSV